MHYLFEFLPSLIFFIIVIFSGVIIRKLLFTYLHKLAQKTESQYDDIVIEVLRGTFMLWWLAIGMYIGLKMSALPDNLVQMSSQIILVLLIVSITISLANICSKLIAYRAQLKAEGGAVTSLTQNIARGFIIGIGVLILLNTMGISITPLLTALGVGGLAVALALQDTLANFFAGFYITLSRQIKIGEYIKLESGEEGYVSDMDWRSTKIRALANYMIILPNSKLASFIVTNYHQPNKELAVTVNLGVDYDSDLQKVEAVTIAVAKEIMQTTPGAVTNFEPFIRYHTFGDHSIQFTVIMRAKEYVDQYLIKHNFVKLLHERYQRENIVIPFPVHTVIMQHKQE
ncbi:MAG: mechanosensitive ion channel family protein [Candidatus Schekmanbacteria bacterium]|nr:mechanosensitive ion channel family protein [Candidatus Schekmanbacteria bacterium]